MSRRGPKLTVVASCEGCDRLTVDGGGAWCRAVGSIWRMIGWRVPDATPAWCPLLAEARAALAREMAAEVKP